MKVQGNKQAPIFTATWDLNLWLQRQLGANSHGLARTTLEEGLALLDAIVFALKGIERSEQLALADGHLIRLRLRLRLAWQAELLTERQAMYLLGLADDIGRQLGGWQKRLAQAS